MENTRIAIFGSDVATNGSSRNNNNINDWIQFYSTLELFSEIKRSLMNQFSW